MPDYADTLDDLSINTIRMLAVDAVERARSGHPGMPMGAAPMAYVLWTKFLRHSPRNPAWPGRDRFVLSAGHGSMLLYALLHLTGYDLSLDDIRNFRQWEGRTPGHPERGVTPGVEVTTGPLGQGFANGVGMAIAERYLAAFFNRPGYDVIDHYTYAIVSDGDLMEGVSQEAASLAGHLGLGRLIYLYDSNRVTLSADAAMMFTEDVRARFEAYGWQVVEVADGNDLAVIEAAIDDAREETKRPSLVIVHTHIAFGSPGMQDSHEAHGAPLGPEEVSATKKNLGWPTELPFHIPEEVKAHLMEAVDKGRELEAGHGALLEAYFRAYPDMRPLWDAMLAGGLPEGWYADIPTVPPDAKGMATRVAGGKVLNAIARRAPFVIGGSGDLDPSTMTQLAGMGSFQRPEPPGMDAGVAAGASEGVWGYAGRNVSFGVREHAMGAVSNGMAAHGGLMPFCATFLVFSDYMRPAIRLAAIMGLKVIYVFTHDSVGVGEDGPTHQPVEHIASLRAIPGLTVIRPADANEAAEAWRAAAEAHGPTALILTRQKVPVLDRKIYAPASGLRRGAYVLKDSPGGRPDAVIIATGSEVHIALDAARTLDAEGIRARVVSMPSWELFEAQPQPYKDAVLPPDVKARLVVEAASPMGWRAYAGDSGAVMGVARFGASAPGGEVLGHLGFTAEAVADKVRGLRKR